MVAIGYAPTPPSHCDWWTAGTIQSGLGWGRRRRLTLTRLRIPILRGARTGTLKKAAAKFELDKKWADTRACQKLVRATTRAATTDFDRFKIMVFRKQRGYAVRHKDLGKAPAKKGGKGKGKK